MAPNASFLRWVSFRRSHRQLQVGCQNTKEMQVDSIKHKTFNKAAAQVLVSVSTNKKRKEIEIWFMRESYYFSAGSGDGFYPLLVYIKKQI